MKKSKALPQFVDVEASSLSNHSYPTEIAWSDESGEIHSYLINISFFPQWTDWDPESEKITGISKKMCKEKGVPPIEVCHAMNRELYDKVIYSDCVAFDLRWINVLFDTCGVSRLFEVKSMNELMSRFSKVTRILFINSIEEYKVKHGRHRADFDVEALLNTWKKYTT